MENTYDISLKEIYVASNQGKDSYMCEDFIIYPEGKEKAGGYLFGIFELRATPKQEADRIIKLLIGTLKEQYYAQINASPDPSRLNLETVFEHALQKTNDALFEMIEIGNLNFTLENLHYLIAVGKPNLKTKDIDFYFTQQGLVTAYMLHKTKQGNYKVLNIVDNTPRVGEDRGNKVKIFSSILSGKIFFHDSIFICSELFSNFIPANKVNQILSNNELTPAIDYFKTLINNARNHSYLTYCAIFVRMEEKKAMNDRPVSQKSIADLVSTKDATEKYLTPTFALNLADNAKKIFGFLKRKKSSGTLQGPKKDNTKINFVAKMMNRFSPAEKNEYSSDGGSAPAKFNKIIIVIIILSIAVLSGSYFWIKNSREQKRAEAAYAAELKTIRDEINSAQANLVYRNEAKSFDLLKQAEESTAKLVQETQAQKANIEELNRQIAGIKNKLLHVEKLYADLVVEIPNATSLSNVEATPEALLVSGADTLYVVNAADKKTDKELKTDAGNIYKILTEGGAVYMLTEQNKVIKYNSTDKSLAARTATFDYTKLPGARMYNGNIYAVDSSAGQILKFSALDGGFAAAANWVKTAGESKLTSAVDLTIDGNMYVLRNDGQVDKFRMGAAEEFKLNPVEPIIKNPKTIITLSETGPIYILDKGTNRVIVFDKTGKLIYQYTFENIDGDIQNIAVSADEKTIFAVAKNKVYRAALK